MMYMFMDGYVANEMPGSLFHSVNTTYGSSRISEQQCDESIRLGQRNGLLKIK